MFHSAATLDAGLSWCILVRTQCTLSIFVFKLTFALGCLPYIMRQLLQQRELTYRRVCGPFMTQLACDPYQKVVLRAQLCGRVCGPMKGLSKSVQCSSVSTTHILYNHALSGGLKLTHTRCTRLIIFNQPEVVRSTVGRVYTAVSTSCLGSCIYTAGSIDPGTPPKGGE